MKLQVALDCINKDDAIKIIEQIVDYVDIVELGTPLIKMEGLRIIMDFKKFEIPILADMKTMDTGFMEAEFAFNLGADLTTVCGSSDDATIKGAIDSATKRDRKIVVDLISVDNIANRAEEVMKLGADFLCVHTGIDSQQSGETPLQDLIEVLKVIDNDKIMVAGGINLENVDKIIEFNPTVIVVGSAITKAQDPVEVTKLLKVKIN